jgi:hypothetical protein
VLTPRQKSALATAARNLAAMLLRHPLFTTTINRALINNGVPVTHETQEALTDATVRALYLARPAAAEPPPEDA